MNFSHQVGVVVASGRGGTTTITSSPDRATPKAVRIAESRPRSVARAARFCSSISLRSFNVSDCHCASRASDTATRTLPNKFTMLDASQNITSNNTPIRSPCRHCFHCFARIGKVYSTLHSAKTTPHFLALPLACKRLRGKVRQGKN